MNSTAHSLTRPKKSSLLRRFSESGWFFISPWLIGFVLFMAVPFVASLYLSFCSYDIISAPKWVGLDNYKELFTQDPLFWKSLYNTFFYAVFAVPLGIVAGVGLALLLSVEVRGVALYRTLFFIPSIVPLVASSILWIWLFNPQIGLINAMLGWVGITGPTWLSSTTWAKPALVMMSIWSVGGSMVIYLAGLKNIPSELYEASVIDGCGIWDRTRHITLPLLTPVIFFNLMMGLISAFQYFTQAYIMTMGGPEDSTLFYGLYLFQRAWAYLDMGYASAMAWILFTIILVFSLAVFRSHTKWVHYDN